MVKDAEVEFLTGGGCNVVNSNIGNGTLTTPTVTSSHGLTVILEEEIQQVSIITWTLWMFLVVVVKVKEIQRQGR